MGLLSMFDHDYIVRFTGELERDGAFTGKAPVTARFMTKDEIEEELKLELERKYRQKVVRFRITSIE